MRSIEDKKMLESLKKQKKGLRKQQKKLKKERVQEQKRREEDLRKSQLHMLIQSTQMSIPIQDVMSGVIITKDQRYLKLMEFMPVNFLMFSNEERNRIVQAFQSMLQILPVKVQFKVFARKAKTESLLKMMQRSHAQEKNDLCRRMQEEYMELILETALREGVSRRFLVIIEYANTVDTDGSNFNEIVHSLNQNAARIRNILEQAGNAYVPSCERDEGVTALLYELLNRRASETEPFALRFEKVRNQYLSEAKSDKMIPIPATEFIAPAWIDYKHPKHIVIDDKFYTFGYFTAEGFPNYVLAGWMSSFINACEGVDVDIFMEKVDKAKVENSIGRKVRNNRAKYKEVSDTSTETNSVANRIYSGLYLLKELGEGEDFFYTSVLVTVTGDTLDEMEYRYKELSEMAKTKGVTMCRAFYQMEDAFESSLPLCKISKSLKNKSRRNMMTSGAASFYPFISFELQDPNGIMLGVNNANNSLVAVDVFDTSRHANANGAIIGKSGFGKTFTAQLLAIRMRLQNIQTFIITPIKGKEDYKRACDQIDGQYISLRPGSQNYINILDIMMPDMTSLQELDGEMESSLLAKKVQDLHAFFHLVITDITQEEEQILDGYIYRLYNNFGITDNNASLYKEGTQEYKEFPLLGDLHEMISCDPDMKRIYNIMVPLVSGSLSMYNQHTNVDLSNKYIVFDLDGAKGTNLLLSMFVTLDFVWSKIKENRLEKKAVFIDEAWRLISGDANGMTADYVKEIFKVIRAYGGAAFVMTQEISDFFQASSGEYGKAIISNADTKICLHLDSNEARTAQEIMSLTEGEYDSITKAPRGVGLVSTGSSKLFVNFMASDFEKDVITTDPQYLRAKLAENQKNN